MFVFVCVVVRYSILFLFVPSFAALHEGGGDAHDDGRSSD